MCIIYTTGIAPAETAQETQNVNMGLVLIFTETALYMHGRETQMCNVHRGTYVFICAILPP